MRWLMLSTQHSAPEASLSSGLGSIFPFAPLICLTILDADNYWHVANTWGIVGLSSNSHIFSFPSFGKPVTFAAWLLDGASISQCPLGTSLASLPSADAHLQAESCSSTLPHASLMNNEGALKLRPSPGSRSLIYLILDGIIFHLNVNVFAN